jgi:hypothetical protein
MTSVAEAFHSFPQILHANTGTAQTISTLLVLFAVILLYRIRLILLNSLAEVLGSSLDLGPSNLTSFCGFHACGVNAGSVDLL